MKTSVITKTEVRTEVIFSCDEIDNMLIEKSGINGGVIEWDVSSAGDVRSCSIINVETDVKEQ